MPGPGAACGDGGWLPVAPPCPCCRRSGPCAQAPYAGVVRTASVAASDRPPPRPGSQLGAIREAAPEAAGQRPRSRPAVGRPRRKPAPRARFRARGRRRGRSPRTRARPGPTPPQYACQGPGRPAWCAGPAGEARRPEATALRGGSRERTRRRRRPVARSPNDWSGTPPSRPGRRSRDVGDARCSRVAGSGRSVGAVRGARRRRARQGDRGRPASHLARGQPLQGSRAERRTSGRGWCPGPLSRRGRAGCARLRAVPSVRSSSPGS